MTTDDLNGFALKHNFLIDENFIEKAKVMLRASSQHQTNVNKSPREPPFLRFVNVCQLNVFVCLCPCGIEDYEDREGLHGIWSHVAHFVRHYRELLNNNTISAHTNTNIFCISGMHVKIVIDNDFGVD